VRTTLSIEDGLLEEAKIRARKQKTTLGAVLNEALRHGLLRGGETAPAEPNAPLKTFRGDGLQPGIDLRDSAGLLEIMERA
jgi:hypothetical protein